MLRIRILAGGLFVIVGWILSSGTAEAGPLWDYWFNPHDGQPSSYSPTHYWRRIWPAIAKPRPAF